MSLKTPGIPDRNYPDMSFSFYLFLGGVSLLFHTLWELIQAEALTTCSGKPWWVKLQTCSVGIVSDLIYTFVLYFLLGWWLETDMWLGEAGIEHYVFVLMFSFAAAYVTELTAQKMNWWAFNEKVPHLPDFLGNVAVTPILQLPLLVGLSYVLTQRFYF